jgi:hypothetical protein
MEEVNPVKYYLARYFFLALSVLQGLATALILIQYQDSHKNRIAALVLFTIALVFFSLHLLLARKIKRVAISKKKLAVINPHKVKVYDWSEVKDIKLLPFLNMYSLKLKGKRNKIYFLPTSNTASVFGIFSSASELIPKKAR